MPFYTLPVSNKTFQSNENFLEWNHVDQEYNEGETDSEMHTERQELQALTRVRQNIL